MNAIEPGNTNQQAPDQDQAAAKVEAFFAELSSTVLNIVQEQQALRSTLGK